MDFPPWCLPFSEQVMVVVVTDGSPPTGQDPVHTGGINGTAMDYRAGHPS